MRLKIVFAGTPDFAVPSLQALIEHHDICAVYTKPDSPSGRGLKLQPSAIKQLVMSDYPTIPILQPPNLKDEDTLRQLQSFQADIMIVIAYGLILPPAVFPFFKYGCINVHASLLPRWRGAAPIQRSLLAGDKVTGVTIMQIDTGLDTGPMLYQQGYDIKPSDNAQALHDQLAHLGAVALIHTLDEICTGNVKGIPQDNAIATYAAKIQKEEGKINWHQSAENIARHVRAFNPWPIAFTLLNGQILKIWDAEVANPESIRGTAGKIINFSSEGLEVATQRGSIYLKKIQLPGGKPISAKDFMNAKRHEITLNETILGLPC